MKSPDFRLGRIKQIWRSPPHLVDKQMSAKNDRLHPAEREVAMQNWVLDSRAKML
jgi:hypothetical protein